MTVKKGSSHYLGEPVFSVSDEGKIIRTAVSVLKSGPCDDYGLLDTAGIWHFFSLDGAISKAKLVLKNIIADESKTGTEVKAARVLLKRLPTTAFRKQVMAQPLVEEKGLLDGLLPARKRNAKVIFPTEYFRPGDVVYAIVTPDSRYGLTTKWRPHPYFVLVVGVTEVSYSKAWPGRLYYSFLDTHYGFAHDRLCKTEAEARERLVALFTKQTDGTLDPKHVKVIPVSVEKKAYRAMMNSMFKSRGL